MGLLWLVRNGEGQAGQPHTSLWKCPAHRQDPIGLPVSTLASLTSEARGGWVPCSIVL